MWQAFVSVALLLYCTDNDMIPLPGADSDNMWEWEKFAFDGKRIIDEEHICINGKLYWADREQ